MNIIEIPENTKTAIAVLRMDNDQVIFAPVAGRPSEGEAIALMFGNFVKILQLSEKTNPEFGRDLRLMFKKAKLETIAAGLIELGFQ